MFRRIRRFPGRSLVYTLIWNAMFAAMFSAFWFVFDPQVRVLRVLWVNLVVANCIGFSIQGGFALGHLVAGAWLDRASFAARSVYYSIVSVFGVFAGYAVSSMLLDLPQLWNTAFSAQGASSILLLSLIISATLATVFFARERQAKAEAQFQRERARSEAAEKQIRVAQLQALEAQIEPHFLYNTLANLQLLIRDDARAAEKMTGDLIQYLRLSVPDFRGGEFTLGREIDLVRAYADIMKIRMRDRLQVDIAVDEAAAAHAFAPLLLHTLVENAIKHGLEPRPEGGRISIEARSLADGGLRITVADTGTGLQEGSHGSGMGLVNLRERLNLLYGERARLSIEPNMPSGVVCVIEIPAAEARAA